MRASVVSWSKLSSFSRARGATRLQTLGSREWLTARSGSSTVAVMGSLYLKGQAPAFLPQGAI